jgi:hypothetical protein
LKGQGAAKVSCGSSLLSESWNLNVVDRLTFHAQS